MKRYLSLFLLLLLFIVTLPSHAQGEPTDLYAHAAVLMDADTGRILFEKNGTEQLPMASTTKIMTLLVTLENADLEGTVQVSSYAASMPDVQLNIREGETYRLRDLCYSLMLESHNDSAVAIAEHVGGSVEGFASMMNQKARDLGCYHTYFITPNGLDAQDENGIHSTSAEDLARIMRCCMQNDEFLTITREPSWSFSDIEGTRSFTVNNKNAFLHMMEGALTGKTGFTNGAGYCYVGALERSGKRLIAVVLACGWPNHKTWKWSDTTKLMNYGIENFHQEIVGEDTITLGPITIKDGQVESVRASSDIESRELLMKEGDEFWMDILMPSTLSAPVAADEMVGTVVYYLNGEVLDLFPIYIEDDSRMIDYPWCLQQIFQKWLGKSILTVQ
ncbi:MAG: D-alanyl-D-alanine carboxypeptidase [Lachnospiraceae bacterium]|jgi:D-alanyl-D-alanine carboxypeptidase (penicillin-binding protein 5/6)|nr:D-alanyl-D-alanine carboxypeptidase [Lachnospiraceae bacterium]MDE7059294.1 D-alanyl-D-alanine carboxypeptidase [Lachnospiraceae bacterium]